MRRREWEWQRLHSHIKYFSIFVSKKRRPLAIQRLSNGPIARVIDPLVFEVIAALCFFLQQPVLQEYTVTSSYHRTDFISTGVCRWLSLFNDNRPIPKLQVSKVSKANFYVSADYTRCLCHRGSYSAHGRYKMHSLIQCSK